MAENCNISYTEAFAMNDIDLGIANAALDKMMKLREKGMKNKGKKGR